MAKKQNQGEKGRSGGQLGLGAYIISFNPHNNPTKHFMMLDGPVPKDFFLLLMNGYLLSGETTGLERTEMQKSANM